MLESYGLNPGGLQRTPTEFRPSPSESRRSPSEFRLISDMFKHVTKNILTLSLFEHVGY